MSDRLATIVSGGAGGIGSAVVTRLRSRGVRVGIIDRQRPPDGDAFAEADVTDRAAVSVAVRSLTDQLGPVDGLVCTAGVVSEATIDEFEPHEFRRVVDVSLFGTFLLAQALVPILRERGGGSIVALSSGYGTSGYRFGGHYAAAKAGVEGFVKSLAREVAPDRIRVNAVAPGPVWTPLLDHLPDPETWRREREASIPLGRIAEPDDVAAPICFLLGDDARYVTGQVLHINGGLLMP